VNLDALYGPRYYVEFPSDDGSRYRVQIRVHTYSGATSFLSLHGRGAIRARWGVEGGAATALDVLRCVMPFTLEMTLVQPRPGAFGWLVGQPDGFIMALLEEADDPVSPTASRRYVSASTTGSGT
jgi:hypothetical protein